MQQCNFPFFPIFPKIWKCGKIEAKYNKITKSVITALHKLFITIKYRSWKEMIQYKGLSSSAIIILLYIIIYSIIIAIHTLLYVDVSYQYT